MTTHHLIVPRRSVLPKAAFGWSDFDRIFDELWSGPGLAARPDGATWAPRIDVTETDTEIRVAAELPGLEEKDIDVSLEDGVLTITGERAAEERVEGTAYHRVESLRGRFERSLRLPDEVDADGVKASYRQGVLTVTLPKTPDAVPRSIPITS